MTLLIVEADLRNLFKYDEAVKQFGGAKVRQWAAWTLNQVGRKMTTQVKRSLVQQTGLKYGEVTDQITVKPANAHDLSYSLTGAGKYFGVGHFKPAQGAKGVRASPWRRRQLFAHAFLRAGRVFVRKGPDRLPIKFLYGPSVPREMERDAIPQDFVEAAERELPGAIDRKLNQMLPW